MNRTPNRLQISYGVFCTSAGLPIASIIGTIKKINLPRQDSQARLDTAHESALLARSMCFDASAIGGTMKIYYLQKDATGRRFIDEKLHEGCTQLDVKEAESWKAARALFSLRA